MHVKHRPVETQVKAGLRDVLYLFVCHLEWHNNRNLAAYLELLAALDDRDHEVRGLAEALLHRSSPRPRPGE